MARKFGLLGFALAVLLAACAPRVVVPVPAPVPEIANALGPDYYCGLRKGAPVPHQVFAAKGATVSLELLGGESAAVGVEEGYYLAGTPADAAMLLFYPGSLGACLFPPLSAKFTPKGPFALVHVFGEDREKVYSEDALNTGERGMRAYEALSPTGKRVGVLILIEEWTDADYNDAVLLLKDAEPVR